MSIELTTDLTTESTQTSAIADWQPPEPPTDLIFDDGIPLENYRHRLAMNLLIDSIEQHWLDRDDFFVGGNMFLYYSSTQARNQDFRGPDFFVVLGVDGRRSRKGWVVWEENGRYPDVIIELLSPSTAAIDRGPKKVLYEQTFKTSNYFIFNPFDANLFEGWHLDVNQEYQPLERNDRGWLWCESLGLWLGAWEGTFHKDEAEWLRFYDQNGDLVLHMNEAAQQQAEQAQQQAEQAQQQAEQAQQQAEQAQQQAEQAQQQTEQAQQIATRQLLRLLQLRFSAVPETLETQLQTVGLEQLDRLGELALEVESIAQFVNHLDEV